MTICDSPSSFENVEEEDRWYVVLAITPALALAL